MNREPINVDTSKNATLPAGDKEPGLPIKIPLSIVRWLAYSVIFMFLLAPWVAGSVYENYKMACGGLILGWFASLLNAIANKK